MLPDLLHLLHIEIIIQLDEAKMRHNLCHGNLGDSSVHLAFKLEEHFLQIILKPLQK